MIYVLERELQMHMGMTDTLIAFISGIVSEKNQQHFTKAFDAFNNSVYPWNVKRKQAEEQRMVEIAKFQHKTVSDKLAKYKKELSEKYGRT